MKLLEQGTLAVPSAQLLQVASSSYVQVASSPVLEVSFGPPSADFGSIWSSQKTRKFRHLNIEKVSCDPAVVLKNDHFLMLCHEVQL